MKIFRKKKRNRKYTIINDYSIILEKKILNPEIMKFLGICNVDIYYVIFFGVQNHLKKETYNTYNFFI